MNTKFSILNKEKQNKIINAALKVFSNVPYKSASTDEIVKEAGISKGSLFHYFKSKKELYLFLYDYVLDILIKRFYKKLNLSETDIFLKYKDLLSTKIELIKQYPNIFDFAMTAYFEEASEIKDEINTKNLEVRMNSFKNIFQNFDRSKFRSDIDPDTAFEMIQLTFDGYSYRESLKLKSLKIEPELFDKWLEDLDEYIEIMKKIYYKGE